MPEEDRAVDPSPDRADQVGHGPPPEDRPRPGGRPDDQPGGLPDDRPGPGGWPADRPGGRPDDTPGPGGRPDDPLLPDVTTDERDVGWGDPYESDDDERFLRDVPPHHGN